MQDSRSLRRGEQTHGWRKMGTTHLLRGAFALVTFPALAVIAVCAMSSAQTERNGEVVQRDGTRLTLGGETFRYCGPTLNGSAWKPTALSIPWFPYTLESAGMNLWKKTDAFHVIWKEVSSDVFLTEDVETAPSSAKSNPHRKAGVMFWQTLDVESAVAYVGGARLRLYGTTVPA